MPGMIGAPGEGSNITEIAIVSSYTKLLTVFIYLFIAIVWRRSITIPRK